MLLHAHTFSHSQTHTHTHPRTQLIVQSTQKEFSLVLHRPCSSLHKWKVVFFSLTLCHIVRKTEIIRRLTINQSLHPCFIVFVVVYMSNTTSIARVRSTCSLTGGWTRGERGVNGWLQSQPQTSLAEARNHRRRSVNSNKSNTR